MAYADHLRKLLAPLGVYELGPQSVSGALVEALGGTLDEVWQILQNGLRDAFPQTAQGEALAQWERALPIHGEGTTLQRRTGISHLLGQAEVSCSAAQLEAALAACGLEAGVDVDGSGRARIRTAQTESAARTALARVLVPAHLEIVWQTE